MMPTRQQVIETVGDEEILFLDPPETFDQAIVGAVYRCGMGNVACYDEAKCIEALMRAEGMDTDDAIEWFQVNTAGAYVGDRTPVFLRRMED